MLRGEAGPLDGGPIAGERGVSIKARLLCLAAALLVAVSCTFGGPGGFKLFVPYVKQAQSNYCTAASVLMWRLYRGEGGVSQTDIFNWEGGAGCTTILRVAQAVVYFTGVDAYWDYDSDSAYYKLVSRQIASVAYGEPVIPVVRFNHTGVIDGGQWEQPSAYYVWDFVYFHDPDYNVGGPDLYIGATDWLQYFCPAGAGRCDQVVSATAVAGWEQDLATYGPNVRVSGGGRSGGGPYAM